MLLFKAIIIHFQSLKRKVRSLTSTTPVILENVYGEVTLTKELRRYNCL